MPFQRVFSVFWDLHYFFSKIVFVSDFERYKARPDEYGKRWRKGPVRRYHLFFYLISCFRSWIWKTLNCKVIFDSLNIDAFRYIDTTVWIIVRYFFMTILALAFVFCKCIVNYYYYLLLISIFFFQIVLFSLWVL